MEPINEKFCISETSVRNFLKESGKVWKMSRPYRAVIFNPLTALASVNFAHAFQQLSDLSGGSEYSNRITFGDETTF